MVKTNKIVSLKLSRRNIVMMNKEMILKEDYPERNFRRRRSFRRRRRDLKRQKRDFDKISNDIKFKVLSCLPPKYLFQFRCVSKEFRGIIDDPLFALEYSRRLAANKIPFTGFFIRNRDDVCVKDYHLSFISTNNTDDGGGLPDFSLRFLKKDQSKAANIKLMDSCNGLLLCKIITTKTKHSTITEEKLYVCNPLTMQKVLVPHPRIHGRPLYKHFAFIAKSTSTGYLRYKVVYIYDIQSSEYSRLWIFSSETGEWEEIHYRLPAVCYGSSLIAKRPRIFVKNNTLIWDCFASGKYILVIYFDNKVSSSSSSRCFELIESPCQYQYVRCLWDYNGKLLFYFNQRSICSNHHRENGELSAWSLCFGDDDKIEWKNENSLQLKTLAEDLWKHRYREEYPGRELLDEIKIVGYNPSLKTMYVLMGGVLLSYELEERRFNRVWKSKRGRYEASVAFQYIHSLEPIEIGRTKTYVSTTDVDESLYDDDGGYSDDDGGYSDDDGGYSDDDPILRDDDVPPKLYW